MKSLPGEEVCSQALGSRSLKLQACEACCSISLQRSFHLLSSQAQKALWYPSNLYFFCGLSVINSLPDRILAGSYNGMYFQGSHFITRKVRSVFPGGCRHHASIGLDSVFLNLVLSDHSFMKSRLGKVILNSCCTMGK